MLPVLFTIGSLTISSFGLFLILGFIFAVIVFWRLGAIYDIDEERRLDLSLITFFLSLIGARIYFVLSNLSVFDSLSKVLSINHYPGLNFWGGFFTGSLVLYLLCHYFKLKFYQIADFFIVGLFAGLIFGSFGCLLSSCQYGVVSPNFGVVQEGLIGNRFPIQAVMVMLYLLSFFYLWKVGLRFHFTGKVISVGLVLLGIIKFFTAFFRADQPHLFAFITEEQLFALLLLITGIIVYYQQSRKKFLVDIRSFVKFFKSRRRRQLVLSRIYDSWYNLLIRLRRVTKMRPQNLVLRLRTRLKGLNVKFNSPKV